MSRAFRTLVIVVFGTLTVGIGAFVVFGFDQPVTSASVTLVVATSPEGSVHAVSTTPPVLGGSAAASRRPFSASPRCDFLDPGKLALPDTLSARGIHAQGACCGAVKGDIDRGWTLRHHIYRLMCAAPLASSRSTGEALPAARRLRILQVGANTGDNGNDHLVSLLKTAWVDALVVEPVPWLFSRLRKTYSAVDSVRPLNVAVAGRDGRLTFQAPKVGSRGWCAQAGGLVLPPKSQQKFGKCMEQIHVDGLTVASILTQAGWSSRRANNNKDDAPPQITPEGRSLAVATVPDVVVIDAEGFDEMVARQVLNLSRRHATWRKEAALMVGATVPGDVNGGVTTGGASPPDYPVILQWEWKHLSAPAQEGLVSDLEHLGYCVQKVHYDTIAVLPTARWADIDLTFIGVSSAAKTREALMTCSVAIGPRGAR